jgi:GTP pyrophosphokinase
VALRFQELEEKLRAARPHEDLTMLREAFEFAASRHSSQKRRSGEPYIAHPLEVAHILAERRLDRVCVITGLLHDLVEDTGVSLAEIEQRFGADIAGCVDGVTKLSRLDYYSAEARQAENFRKLLLAMVRDIRVVLVKLADRLHNMRTLEFLPAEKQRSIARETAEIYAPIALRLGMGKIRGELEDLSFRYLEPESYQAIQEKIESRRESSEDFLDALKTVVAQRLAEADIPVRVEGRIKRASSIHNKVKRQQIAIDEVYDLLALRVITDSVKNCYATLGLIHSQWRPVPGRIKDFIAMPRPNLYQSLHTSVITDTGQTFEVQIRTEEMHRMAEEGICAHWKYKEGRVGADVDDQRMAWLRQLVEWQQEVSDPSDFLSTLKVDLYPEEVYVFTPKGKLIALPRGATAIDFAYAIHTEVGHSCVGAKSNGRIVPLRTHLRNGDILEIITQPGHRPSSDWLNVVKTSRARNKIKHWLNTHRRKKAEEIGVRLLEKEARRLKVSLKKVKPESLEKVCRDYGCPQAADLHAALGYGRYSARQVLAKLFPDEITAAGQPARSKPADAASSGAAGDQADGLVVTGIDDVLVYRAGCCNPIRGEPIVGYVTRGKGVAVHSRSCPNVENLMYEAERRIDVEWARSGDLLYKSRLLIEVSDRAGLLNDLTNVLTNESVNISSVESRTNNAKGNAIIEMTIAVGDVKQLDRIVAAMQRVPDVRHVMRSAG